MEVKKIKILLEDYISKNSDSSYGKLTATTLNVNVFITQDIKDMGIFNVEPFVEYDKNNAPLNYYPLTQKVSDNGGNFNFINQPGINFYTNGDTYDDVRYPNKLLSDYYTNNIIVTGLTEDRLENVASYGYTGTTKYVPGFDLEKSNYYNYLGNQINGVSRVISVNDNNPIIYTEFGNINDNNFGTILQSDGILFQTYLNTARTVNDIFLGQKTIPLTKMSYQGQGFNKTNIELSAITMDEYMLHIAFKPTVESDLYVDRSNVSVMQEHLQLGEIKNMGDLINYGNGYYNII